MTTNPAIPQPDGALVVDAPDAATRYDIGNQALYATLDGRGSLQRLLFTEGLYAGGWQLDLFVADAPLDFQQARAIGRLWELRGRHGAVECELDTFLEEDAPALYQRCRLRNTGPDAQPVRITLQWDYRLPLGIRERLVSHTAGLAARWRVLAAQWDRGAAKVMQPRSASRVVPVTGGFLRAGRDTTEAMAWGSVPPPSTLQISGHVARAGFEIDLQPGESIDVRWALARGDERAVTAALERHAAALDGAREYAHWLSSRAETGDPLRQSLLVAGLNAAIAAFKQFPDEFAGLMAGPDYAYPPRLYYRDSYWTAQALLPWRLDLVRRHLLSLARGVHADGRCPSGVFAPHMLREWRRPAEQPLDWLPDHYDSPPFFVLLLDEYLAAGGDPAILDEQIPAAGPPRTLCQAAFQAADYLTQRDRDGDGLIEKPHAANDWADNVRRNVWVTYDQALYAAVLQAGERLASRQGDRDRAERYRALFVRTRLALETQLWDERLGYYVNYRRPGFTETNLSIDTLLVLRYGLASDEHARRLLAAMCRLQTRNNPDQPRGDWGVMCVFPPYRRAADLFEKSAFPYRYHNGADWPVWDGVYARELRRRGDPDWQYVATRWWEYGLRQGWLTPVEFYSPAFPPGGMLQGWSGMPAAVVGAVPYSNTSSHASRSFTSASIQSFTETPPTA